jgi:spore maturation protein CgeB
MRLLYVGQLWHGGTCVERMRALQRLGFDILPFDVTPFGQLGSRIERSLARRTGIGRWISRINAQLATTAREARFDAVWIDKGIGIYRETVAMLRAKSERRIAVHYTPDAQILDNYSRHFVRSIPIYDLLVTTKPFELDLYSAHGANEILLVLEGHGRQFAPRVPTESDLSDFASDVSFIGHYQSHRAARLKAVSKETERLQIWGSRWPRYAFFHSWARPCVRGEGLWGDRYPIALSCAKIGLGLLSKWIPEITTTRTFEIPATGVFMLAERNPHHLALFKEGKEAEFFASDDELRDKVRFYLRHDAARIRVAAAGRQRCLTSGYSQEHQLRRVFERLHKCNRTAVALSPSLTNQ